MTASVRGEHDAAASLSSRLRSSVSDARALGRVWALVALMWLAVGLLWSQLVTFLPALAAPHLIPWPVLAVLFFAAERFPIDLEVREQTHSFSLSEIPLILGLVMAAPADLLVGQALGAGTALLLRHNQRLVKMAFNLASFALSTSAAIVLFRLIVGTSDPLSTPGWLGAFGAGIASDVLGAVAVSLVIWLSQGERPTLAALVGFGTVYTLAATTLGLAAATILWHAPEAAWLLLVLVAIVYAGIRLHGQELKRQRSLISLHESTRSIRESLNLDDVSRSLLRTASTMLEADVAELLLFPEHGDEAALMRMTGDEDQPSWETFRLDPRTGVWARVAAESRGVLIHDRAARGMANKRVVDLLFSAGRSTDTTAEPVRMYFAARGIRAAAVVPLREKGSVIGTLLVGNRRGTTPNWSRADLTLLETLANHAAVALQNGRQTDELARQRNELEWRATHDDLTNLPNRVLFHQRLVESIETQPQTGGAVLLMDLDRFKEVNDTLGHRNGDQLLRDVAERLVSRVPAGSTVARLGGDEFGVLLPNADISAALRVAEDVLSALERAFVVRDVTVQVEASVGVAHFGAGGVDADTILRRADVAMYRAKALHLRLATYEPQHDPYSEARLALLGELRSAIEAAQLNVIYQPQVDPRTGAIVGAEALVRWRHPQRGDLPPDEFVPLAERSEAIHQLTRFVLRDAIARCAEWRDAGAAVRVAVNLSARSLHDASLARDVEALLREHSLPAEALQLEITETSIEADPAGSERLLELLNDMGVAIAIDDFGTGYSAFSYLRRLPVDEIKIDRSFVMAMEHDQRSAQIVRSTIQLGHNLGLRVVGEGVASETALRQLQRLGCDIVQGFHVGRPMSADMVSARLRSSRTFGAIGAASRADGAGDGARVLPLKARRPA